MPILSTTNSMLQLQLPLSLDFHQTSLSSRPKFPATNKISLPWCLMNISYLACARINLLSPSSSVKPTFFPHSQPYLNIYWPNCPNLNLKMSWHLPLFPFQQTTYLSISDSISEILSKSSSSHQTPTPNLGVGPHYLLSTGLLQEPNTSLLPIVHHLLGSFPRLMPEWSYKAKYYDHWI